jgi:hypothetical protein
MSKRVFVYAFVGPYNLLTRLAKVVLRIRHIDAIAEKASDTKTVINRKQKKAT